MKRIARILVGLAVLLALVVPLGSVSAQLTYSSAFQLQNLENTQAGITIKFYNQDGTEAATVTDTIGALLSKTYFAVSVSGLPTTFAGSAVVTSDRDIRAIHNLTANSYAFGASSAGYTAGANEVNLPLIMRNNSGYNTWFGIQNAGDSDAIVSVQFRAGSAGSNYTAPNVTIKKGASHFFYQDTETNLGSTFVGSAKATSTNSVPIVGTVVVVGPTTLSAYDGFTASSANLIAPLFQYNNAGYISGIQIQNVGTASTNVTVGYTPGTLMPGTACAETQTIAAGQSATFGLFAFAPGGGACYTANPGTAFVGWAQVTTNSASQPLVGIANQLNAATSKAAAYSTFRPDDAKQKVSLPLIMDRNSNYFTGYTILNVGPATTVTVQYYQQGSSAVFKTETYTLAANASQVVLNQNQLANAWVGSATVTGASASDKLIVVVNEVNLVASGDAFYTYNGFGY